MLWKHLPTVFPRHRLGKNAGDLRIIGLGMREMMSGGIIHRPYGLCSYFIALFTSAVLIRIHGVERHFPPNSLIIWEPDMCQRYGNTPAPWEYSWLNCDGPFLPQNSTG